MPMLYSKEKYSILTLICYNSIINYLLVIHIDANTHNGWGISEWAIYNHLPLSKVINVNRMLTNIFPGFTHTSLGHGVKSIPIKQAIASNAPNSILSFKKSNYGTNLMLSQSFDIVGKKDLIIRLREIGSSTTN